MNYIICGLPGSGKSTVAGLLKEIGQVGVMDILEVGTSVESLLANSLEKTQIIVVECPVILCFSRQKRRDFTEFLRTTNMEQKEKILKYVTELPGCTIIKNDLSLDHLRLQIKKLLKK